MGSKEFREDFFGRAPLFLPGSWLLLLGIIAFCYSVTSITIVYADTENENLKIAGFILLFASFIVSICGLSWNYYFYEESKHNSILRRAYGGYQSLFLSMNKTFQ
ncbi:unnamed protein product [Brachionus calyciflorus]|uniref:Uncharacterized protein n=1 Tax=Brachionus calyciflorus TaxID=104777 RepID=A0A814GQF4_9BILA|nr:unnamed protein product [Brachionus calyciflorus]